MSTHLEHLKGAELELEALTDAFPNLETSLDHRLRIFFPRLPEDVCTDFLYLNYPLPPETGQSPVLVSQTLSELIDECYLSQMVPTFVQGFHTIYNISYSLDPQDAVRTIGLAQLEKYLEFTTFSLELCVRDALRDFWNTASAKLKAQTPKEWLSQFVARLILSEANLRRADQTLSVEAMTAISQVFPATGTAATMTGSYGLYSLTLKGPPNAASAALYGAFAIAAKDLPTITDNLRNKWVVQDSASRTVVLYTPSSGLEAFESLTAFTQEMSARLKDAYQRETLLAYVLTEDRDHALTCEGMQLSPIAAADAPTFYSAQVIEKQQKDMRHAWTLARSKKEDTAFEQLAELVEQSLNSSLPIRPAALLKARYSRLIESKLPLWLKTASDADKTLWRLGVERLNHEREVSHTPNAHPLNQIGQKSTLLAYARIQLTQRIKADHGIEVDPDGVYISTTQAVQTGPVINPIIGSAFAAGNSLSRTGPTTSYITTRRSLSELALSNVGKLDADFALTARIKDAAGNIHPVLTPSYLKALVRTLDVGQRYKNLLNDLLVNSAQAKWRKERYVEFKKAQLSLDLLEARLSGNLTADDVAWVQAVIDAPVDQTRPLLNGEQVKVHLLMLRYKPVPSVLVFSSTASNRLLCYIPGAPNKTWFLTANSRNELSQKLSQQQLRAYVLHRVTPAQQAYIKPLIEKGLTDATVTLQAINHDVYEASYDTEALHAIHDADEQSTATWESNLNTAIDTALTVIDIVSIVLPTKVLLPVALARFSYQIILGIDALQRDQEHEALLCFLDAITHLTDGASDFVGSAVFSSSLRQRAKQPTPKLSPDAASTAAAQHLTLRSGETFGGGVYVHTSAANGRSEYLLKTKNDALYTSRYDNLDETWRALDERHPHAVHSHPMHELSKGIWDVDPNVQPKTGMQRIIESAQVDGIDLASVNPDSHDTYRVSNKRYIQQNGIVFEVFSNWLRRGFYLQLPSDSSRSVDARYKLRRIAGHWEIQHKLSNGTQHWEPLIRDVGSLPEPTPAIVHSDYDVPAEFKTRVDQSIRETRGFLDTTSAFRDAGMMHLKRMFTELRFKLLNNAREYLETHVLKPRVNRPALSADISLGDFFKRLFEHTDGIVFGETHAQQGGKKVLITQMEEVAKSGVKVLYLEHLQTDLHQTLLDDFNKTGKMPVVLDEFLKRQDLGHHVDPASPYNYSQLVREAQRHAIEVKALDCMASYNPKSMKNTLSGEETASPALIRYQMFSYFGSQIIRANQLKNGGKKFLALVGNTHANTFEGVPGLAELEGLVGVRVSDIAPGKGHGIRQDIVDISTPSMFDEKFRVLKNDYWLEMEIPGSAPARAGLSDAQLNERLKSPGWFRFESAEGESAQLIHRASNGQIVRTPLRVDPHGTFYIERENWESVHQKRYDRLDELIKDLRERSMTHVQ